MVRCSGFTVPASDAYQCDVLTRVCVCVYVIRVGIQKCQVSDSKRLWDGIVLVIHYGHCLIKKQSPEYYTTLLCNETQRKSL